MVKNAASIPDIKANPDESNNPNEDKDQEAVESEDMEVAEDQMSPGETEEEVLNHEIEKPEVRLPTAVEIKIEQPEETLPTPEETTILGTENEVPVDLENNVIEQEVSLLEIEATKVTANSEELDSENDSLLQASDLTSNPPDLTVQGSAEVIEEVKDQTEPVSAPEEEVKETAVSSVVKVEEMEVNSSEAAVKNQLEENVRETVVLAGVAIEEGKESVLEIQPSNSEIGNLEVLEAKIETLVAAMNNQKVEMVNPAEEGPRESSANIEAVQVAELVKEAAAAIEGTVEGLGEVTVDVTSLTENEYKGKSADDPVLHQAKESGINPIEEALVTPEPIPVLKEEISGNAPVQEEALVTPEPIPKEEISGNAPVQEGPTNPIEEASSDLAITTDIDGKEDDELASVQPQIVEISDELKPSSSEKEGKQSETVGNNLEKDAKVASAEVVLSPSADSSNSTKIFNVRTVEGLAEANAVLRKYGINIKRKDNFEDQGDVTVKITKQK